MKFRPASIPKIEMSKLTPSQLMVGVLTFFVICIFLTIILSLFIGRQGRIEQALLATQRLEVDLGTGKVFGTVQKSKESLAEEKKQIDKGDKNNIDKSAPDTNNNKDGIVKDVGKVAEKVEADEFAWIDEDFIGPRMPQDIIDILMEGDKGSIDVKKVHLSDLSDKPIIVIILKGLGLSASTTEGAMDLPKEVTFGFSPYSSSIESWVKKAKDAGHEIVLNIPMETKDYRLNDPGPYALVTQSSKEDNITRLKMLLGLVKGYEAVYSEREEIFTHTLSSSKPVLEELKKQHKYFIFGGGYADFSLIQQAEDMGYPIVVNDFILDNDISIDDINSKLEDVEKSAKDKGYVVVMAHPYPLTIRMLEQWIPKAEARGFTIAPISLLLGKQIIKDK